MGPGLSDRFESQAKANYLISIAANEKDCMAVCGPHMSDLVRQSNPETTNRQFDFILWFTTVFVICSI